MPSSVAHAVAGVALASIPAPAPAPRRLWVCAALCAAAPDVDLLWGRHVTWGSWLAHRGFTHSLVFAVVLGVGTALAAFPGPRFAPARWRYALALVLATASHGILDSMALYGAPVMMLWPFTTHRYQLPWHLFGVVRPPWPGSPLRRVLRVVAEEAYWVALPSVLILIVTRMIHRAAKPAPQE